MRYVGKALRTLEGEIMALHRTSGRLSARSHRRRPLKMHAGLVVAALRHTETRIDVDPTSLSELAAMVMTIGERATAGRIGALLDTTHFPEGLTPARDWDFLRLPAAAVLIAAVAVCASLLHLPKDSNTYVIGGSAVVVLTLLYGRRVRQFLDLLGVLGGP
ncbi:hypothetical protein [Streptomyces bungoensis]|uniref:hypothetical protein n=1 Tax=Streptomyces bungoensis TaxID=285568 RepID=UPI003432CABF